MARPKKWPPTIHKHHTGNAYIRANGRDYWLGRHGSPEATAAYLRVVVDLQAGHDPAPSGARHAPSLTVGELVRDWWAREAPRLSSRGGERDAYRLSLEPLLALWGPTPAAEFTADRLEAVQLAMATASWMTPEVRARREKITNRGPVEWSARLVNQRIGRIKTLWRWAERKDLVQRGSWGNLRSLPGLKAGDPRVRHLPRVRPVSLGDVVAVMTELQPHLRAALRLLWWSGMRPGELRLMRACDIDRSGPVWVYRPQRHKTDRLDHARAVPLGPRCQAVLRPMLAGERDPSAYLVRPSKDSPAHPYSDDALCRAIARAAARAGVAGFFAYRLRHSCKQRITREHGLDAARSVLGQRSLGTTNSYAAGIDLDSASEAAKKCG